MMLINGKRMSNTKVDAMVEEIVHNIVLSGFTTSDELYGIIVDNTSHSLYLNIRVLNKLLDIYTINLQSESNKMTYGPNNNVHLIANKMNIVIQCICTVQTLLDQAAAMACKEDEYIESDDDDFDEIDSIVRQL